MKRLFIFFPAALIAIALSLVPATLSLSNTGSLSLMPNIATAACSGDSIEVSIPVFGTDKCVPNDPANGGAIVWYIKELIKLVGGAVGSIILLMMVVGGVQYITSAGSPTAIKSAKGRITNSLIALILYLMAYAILNFLIPGGIFN